MRLLLYGNTNNLPLQYARELRAAGHSVDLVFNSKAPLHNPDAALSRWRPRRPAWIVDHSHLSEADYVDETAALERAIEPLAGKYEFAIVTELGPSIAHRLGCPHAMLAAGSDVSFYASQELVRWRSASWSDEYRQSESGRAELERIEAFVNRQRRGIAEARFVITAPRGHQPSADCILDSLGVGDARRAYGRAVDTKEVKFTSIRPTLPLRVTSCARVDFLPREDSSELDDKGTDVLLEGFARAAGQSDLRLLLPRKGHDAAAAEQIVDRLGVGSRVEWFPERPRRSYLRMVYRSVVVCDSLGASGPAGVTHDALAAGRIPLGNLQPEVWSEVLGAPYFGIHATQPDEVADALTRVYDERDELDEWSRRARGFALERLSIASRADRVLARIDEAKRRDRLA